MANSTDRRRSLLEKANTLPLCPGVYLMRDRTGRVIYVGKSRKLKQRVSQYFQDTEKNVKTARMVSQVQDFDYFLCDNEMEALSLENALIKQYSPKYNIRLKDAKTYPYIKLTAEEYPRLQFTRHRAQDKAKYFGPYSGVSTAYSLIDLLQKSLRMPSCSRRFPRDIGKGRPCINYQMHRCCGVCTGQVSKEEYAQTVQNAVELLSGKNHTVKKRLEAEMYEHADAERYEAAAKCRDTIRALDAIGQKQKVVAAPDVEQDVIAFYADPLCSCVSVFYIRSGILQDKADFLYGADSILEADDMSAFICEHYKRREYIPPQVLLAFPQEEAELQMLSAYLTELAGHKVTVRVPERGTMKTLCELVEKNAADQAKLYRIRTEKEENTLVHLADLLCLESYPQRIEAYDISNFGSEHLTAGMVVCKDGRFSKADYRVFRIRSVAEGTDDYASMREALFRRLEHLRDEGGSFSELPDLILLDGGKGHVSVVRALLCEMGLSIPVFGMVKDDFHKTRALCTDTEEIGIAGKQDVFSFVYRIQEEVHRFTVSRMSQAKQKTLKTSSLTQISGIGEVKAKKLLHAFGGIGAVKKASTEELRNVRGISERDAKEIWLYFHANHTNNEEEGATGQ